MLHSTRPHFSPSMLCRSSEPQGRRSIAPLLVMVSVVAALILLGSARGSAALEVVACMSIGTPAIAISSDPRSCPADRLIDAVAGASGWTVPAAGGATQAVEFQLTKRLDRTSPTLFLDAVSQRRLSAVLVVFFDGRPGGSGQRLYSLLLTDVLITSLANSAADDGAASAFPLEAVTFRYRSITVRDDASGVQQCWDFQLQRLC
jgi:type VI protein secretion system component Hcp